MFVDLFRVFVIANLGIAMSAGFFNYLTFNIDNPQLKVLFKRNQMISKTAMISEHRDIVLQTSTFAPREIKIIH